MSSESNRQVILVHRPTGIAQASDFAVIESKASHASEGQITVRNRFLSVEPAMRGWIADLKGYSEPVPLGSVMRALCVGEVVQSRHRDYEVGDHVMGWFGWQNLATVDAGAVIRKILEHDLPLSLALGVTGLNGATALIGLTKFGEPKPGDTVVVSTAAGAVGSAVGQIAKILGCRTVGFTGGADKVNDCIELFGYESAFDYRHDDLEAAMVTACPNGVDVYFDNTAGQISDTVHRHLALNARVVICGTASVADWSHWPAGPRVERHLLVKRARIQGFVLFDHMDLYEQAVAQLAGWVREGKLLYQEDILDGIEACPDAIAGLYRGENRGKRLIRV